MIGRCDGGGLAALTREVHRHLNPARTLLLDLEEQGRGACIPDDYAHDPNLYRITYKGGLADAAVEWLTAEGVDVLWSAETFYEGRIPLAAHRNGIRTIVYAMPELASWPQPPRAVTVPTTWRLDALPNATLLPMPVARDRLPYRHRPTVEHLYHVAGAAMLDRNGTQTLLDALPFIAHPVRVTIRSERPLNVPACDLDVTVLDEPAVDYWDAYPPDIDLLVMPRRYGGLSLPVQECASLGVPSLMLQTDPYAQEAFVTAVPSVSHRLHPMKGCPRPGVPVHTADPRAVAHAIDWLIEHPDLQAQASVEADWWAASHDWKGPLGGRWRAMLDSTEGTEDG